MKAHFAYILFLIQFCLLSAQQPASIQLTEKDGLPDIEFYNIIEDSKKFIWLAADKGLYRYDGREYKSYRHPKQRGNAVFGTLEDGKGRVWCNNISGQFFYVENDELKLFIDLSEILNGELSDFLVTPNELVVLNPRNIYRINLKTKKSKTLYSELFPQIGIPSKSKTNYYYNKQNKLYKTDLQYNITDSLFFKIHEKKNNKVTISRRVAMASDNNVVLCYFLKNGLNTFYAIDFESSKTRLIELPDILQKRVINQIFFKDSDIWIATDLGIFMLEFTNDKLLLKKQIFKNKYITKILKDYDSNYWITTKGDGIYVITNVNVFQSSLPKAFSNVHKLKKVGAKSLLFGTNNGGVFLYNVDNKNLKYVDTSSVFRVTDIVKNKNNSDYIITKEDKSFSFNLENKKIKTFYKKPINGAKSLNVINDDTYILSSYRSAVLLNRDFEEIKELVPKRSYTNFYSELNKILYVSSVNGLFSFDKNFNKTEITTNDTNILVVSIAETTDGKIWVSTFNKGIYGILDNKVFINYNNTNGLLSNKTSVIESDGTMLWITTEKGIQRLNTKNKTFSNLTKQNGIPSYRINDIELLDDRVLFASNIGIFGVDKTKVFKPEVSKNIYFTEFRANDSVLPIKDNYMLDYDQNKISISFNTNGFESLKNTKYVYRIKGLDNSWKPTTDLVNTIAYNNLSSGNYVFEVKFSKDDTKSSAITFLIAKPFWKQLWFIFLAIGLIGFLLFVFYTRKIKSIKKKQQSLLQKEMVNKQLILSQLENLRSQMNPHFIFNALNSIQEYIVLNEKDLASSFLIKFSRLIRIYLDHSRESEVLLSEELKAIKIYLELEKNRFEDLLNYNISVLKNIDVNTVKVPSLFIQPYIENALKHGLLHKTENRNLQIDFSLNAKKNTLICSIEDNGIGVEASKKINEERYPLHKSFASSANQKRVELLNTNRLQKIEVAVKSLASEFGNGTVVIISIPIKN